MVLHFQFHYNLLLIHYIQWTYCSWDQTDTSVLFYTECPVTNRTEWPIAENSYGYPIYMLNIENHRGIQLYASQVSLIKMHSALTFRFFLPFCSKCKKGSAQHSTTSRCLLSDMAESKQLRQCMQVEPQHVLNVLRTPFRTGWIHTLTFVQSHFSKEHISVLLVITGLKIRVQRAT